jgi:HPt (histidine-containing phosphotransfer) domain-containing protein
MAVAEQITIDLIARVGGAAGNAGEQPPPTLDSQVAVARPRDPAFDEAQFRDYLGHDDVVILTVVRSFLADAPMRLATMQAALRAGDAPTLERLAHSLKGIVAFFAAAATLGAACELERIAKTRDLQHAPAAGAALESELARLTAALEAILPCTPSHARG